MIHEVKGWRVGEKEKQVHPSGEQAYTNLWKRIGMSVVPAERKTGHGTGCVGGAELHLWKRIGLQLMGHDCEL